MAILPQALVRFGGSRVKARLLALLSLLVVFSSLAQETSKPARYDECSRQLVDEVFIGNQLGSGRATPDELRNLALNSKQPLEAERLQKVLKLIDEAEKAQSIQVWFDKYWKICLGSI